MGWNVQQAFVPNPAELAARPDKASYIGAAVVGGVTSAMVLFVVGAAMAGSMQVTGVWSVIPGAIGALALLITPLLVVAAEQMLGLRGPVAARLALVLGLPAAVVTAALVALNTTHPQGTANSAIWMLGGMSGAVVGGATVCVGMLLAWALARRERPWLDRALSRAVWGMGAVVLVLAAVGAVRSYLHPALSYYPGSLPESARMDAVSVSGWVESTSSEDPVREFWSRRAGFLVHARCAQTCEVWLDPDGDSHRAHDAQAMTGVGLYEELTLRRDDRLGVLWLQGYGSHVHAFRLSDGRGLTLTPADVMADSAPPLGWLLLALASLGVAAAALALREHNVSMWSRPETWRAGRIGEGRWITFADGGGQRQAAPYFASWQGEVVVIPSVAGSGGPFRGDGAPSDGWVVPATAERLASAVRATRAAADATALAVLAAGAAPLVLAAVRGFLRPW